MDEIGDIINFNVNENRPNFDNHNVNSNDNLKRSAENKLSAVESVAFFQSSLETDKQELATVSNNCQNEKLNSNLEDYAISVISNNSKQSINSLLLEAGTTKADSINSFDLDFEAASNIETSKNITANLSVSEISEGNVNFLPDALSDEICSVNQKNLSNSVLQCIETSLSIVGNVGSVSIDAEELKDVRDNSCMVIQDLVDFSFREQENVTDELIEGSAAVDSASKHPETFLYGTLEKISDVSSTANKQENKPVSTSVNYFETDSVKVTNEQGTCSHLGNVITDATENHTVLLNDSTNHVSQLSVSGNPEKKAISNVVADVETSLELEKPNRAAEEVSGFEPINDKLANNEYARVNSDELAFQVPEISASNDLGDISPLKVEKVSFGMSDKPLEQFSDPDFAFKLPENTNKEPDEISHLKVGKVSFGISVKPLEQFSDPDSFKLPENPNKEPDEFSPLKVENISFGMSDKPLEQFSNPDSFKLPENLDKEPNEFSPLKAENVSFGMSDEVFKQASDPDFVFKLPENPSNNELIEVSPLKAENVSFNGSKKPLGHFSDPDSAFKVPEVPPNNPLGQLRNTDFTFKVPETPLTNEGDEQFVDAAQFFRDPNSFQFLENIRTSTVQPGPTIPRSSLYVNFDPLHSKFQTNLPRPDNCELISAAMLENSEKCSPEVINKQLADIATRESLGNILISFDSPKSSTNVDSKLPTQILSPPKMITEEELQQILKIHELETQEAYLKKQREMEIEIAKRDELLKSQHIVIEEFCGITVKFSEDIGKNKEIVISLEEENEKLKEDLKTSAEDLQSVENTFTDFYKRYEQCKGMLKTYKDNEEHLKQTILDLQTKAKEQEQMYNMLQERTEEMLEKANVEVDNVKRSGEAQVTVLKAQLKKAEMKISSLESDMKQIRMENSQLGGICDDLMAKVSNT